METLTFHTLVSRKVPPWKVGQWRLDLMVRIHSELGMGENLSFVAHRRASIEVAETPGWSTKLS